MGKFKHDVQVSLCDAIGVILITALFGLCWFGFYDEKLYAPFHLEGWCVVALFCPGYRHGTPKLIGNTFSTRL